MVSLVFKKHLNRGNPYFFLGKGSCVGSPSVGPFQIEDTLHGTNISIHIPPGEKMEIIDSKVPTGRGYVSLQEGRPIWS